MSKVYWILGSSDPEMEAIECLLREAGERVIYALGPDGQRVRADSAYRVAALSEPIPAEATVYRVECDGPAIPADAIVIDHHRPGDPGYGRPPEEFLPASSIGQTLAVLARLERLPKTWRLMARHVDATEVGGGYHAAPDRGVGVLALFPALGITDGVDGTEWEESPGWWVQSGYHHGAWVGGVYDPTAADPDYPEWCAIPRDVILCAAADHCLSAAYRGECPGVDPDALMRWRVECRAKFQGRNVETLLADVERARATLREAPALILADAIPCDYHAATGADVQCGHCRPDVFARDMRGPAIPELPEAAAREGECFLASLRERDGKTKVVCQSGTPSQIEAFMRVWAPSQGLTGIYGDPARGFAGGYT